MDVVNADFVGNINLPSPSIIKNQSPLTDLAGARADLHFVTCSSDVSPSNIRNQPSLTDLAGARADLHFGPVETMKDRVRQIFEINHH